MAIDPTKAEAACEFLRQSAKTMHQLWLLAREAEDDAEQLEAQLIIEFHEEGCTPTIARAKARADARWKLIKSQEARAMAAVKGLEARRDSAKTTISLYQSEVKDRI